METIICFAIIAIKAGEIIIPFLVLVFLFWNIETKSKLDAHENR